MASICLTVVSTCWGALTRRCLGGNNKVECAENTWLDCADCWDGVQEDATADPARRANGPLGGRAGDIPGHHRATGEATCREKTPRRLRNGTSSWYNKLSTSRRVATVFACALITGTQTAMADLVGVADLSLVRATAREQSDGQWSVVAYAPTDTLDTLAPRDYQVAILSDETALQQRWDAIQNQIEE
jgi:hypothetical protein